MRKITYILFLGFISFFALSCSEATIEEDAQRAAELTMMSNQYSMENDMSNAGKAYTESQEIMNKYKKLDKFDEFYQIYLSFLEEGSYRLDDSDPYSIPVNDPSENIQ